MPNGNGFVQRAPLPPLNSPTIAEGDRPRVYGVIGKELNNILNGSASYHADGVKKRSNDLLSERDNFIGAMGSLKDAVNDPANIVGDAVRDLGSFRKAFEDGTRNDIARMWNDAKDGRDKAIQLPNDIAPTTEDNNTIFVDPNPKGPYSTPNPVSPGQWRRDLRASYSPDQQGTNSSSIPSGVAEGNLDGSGRQQGGLLGMLLALRGQASDAAGASQEAPNVLEAPYRCLSRRLAD
jgi:hypothetical protein